MPTESTDHQLESIRNDNVAFFAGLPPYRLASDAGVSDPDTPTSPGAAWLADVADDIREIIPTDADDIRDAIARPDDLYDVIAEHADGAVPIYTHNRWQVFADLGAWTDPHDGQDLAGGGDDMTARAGTILYAIASGLLHSLTADCLDAIESDAYDAGVLDALSA